FGPNPPPLEGIEAYEGKSVFYYVTHRESFRSKRVVIAGGGDTAVDWALSLADVAQRVSVIHRRDKFRAAPESEARLKALVKAGKIDLVVPYQLDSLEGAQGQLKAVTVATLDGATRHIEADVLLPFFGLSMSLGPIADWELALQHNQIGIDAATTATNRPGIFDIGAVLTYPATLAPRRAPPPLPRQAEADPDRFRRSRHCRTLGLCAGPSRNAAAFRIFD